MRRLTAVREPGKPGYDAKLFANQYSFIQFNYGIFVSMRRIYSKYFDDYMGAEEEARLHHGDPHPKRALRLQAWKEMNESGDVRTKTWTENIRCKQKPDEYARPNKYPRTIGDLGVQASLRGFRLTECIKVAMASEPICYRGGMIEFVKSPSPDVMERAFARLIDPPGRYYACVFSDDSCFSVRTKTGIQMFNVDISCCDGSHGPAMFEAYKSIFPDRQRGDVEALIDQCATPLSVYSVEDARDCVVMRPKSPMLYSGSTITTSINNLASILIYMSIADHPYVDQQSIVNGAERVGYIVTTERCHNFRNLQFLKHSPVLDVNGHLRPLLNLGVLLRASGVCRGDLPGLKRESLHDRAKRFQSALLVGAYPLANFALLTNMKNAARIDQIESKQREAMVASLFEHKVVRADDYPPFEVSEDEVYARYSLTGLEVLEVTSDFGKSGVGCRHSTSGLTKIMTTDYGLACKFNLSPTIYIPALG